MVKRVAFYTLGCKANQYDTEAMKEKIRGEPGLELVPFDEEPDISIINTCSVTTGADRKSRKYVRRAARKSETVLVTGCYTVLDSDLLADISGVDGVFPNSRKKEVVRIIKRASSGSSDLLELKPGQWEIDEQTISRDSNHTRAFLKIQDGCSNSCSFCKVHLLRGPARSKAPGKVIEEARSLGQNGFEEVVLTGINLEEYGEKEYDLAELIRELADVETISRIRLSSINPGGITEKLLSVFAGSESTCPYFHIPLQSGSDRVLEKMSRGYTKGDYLAKIDLIEQKLPGATFGTDIMVGFPGETDGDFEETLDTVRGVRFINVHVFRYSPREVTPASDFDNKVGSTVKKARSKKLREIAASISREKRTEFLGEKLEMIVEERSNKVDGWRGYSKNYLDLHIPEATDTEGIAAGERVSVRVSEINDGYCLVEPGEAKNVFGERSSAKVTG